MKLMWYVWLGLVIVTAGLAGVAWGTEFTFNGDYTVDAQGQWTFKSGNPDYDRALNLCVAGRPREALPYFDRAIQRDPTCPEFYINRAECNKNLGDYPRVIQDASESIRLYREGWRIR